MPQVFGREADTILRGTALVVGLGVLALAAAASVRAVVPAAAPRAGPVVQPVPFSHEHHVGSLGIGCRYCHTGVEESPFAGLPQTRTCMTCHSQLWTEAPVTEPIRESARTGTPIHWKRVNDLPDHVYFDHSVHVANGVACESCHGRVDRMPLTRQAAPLTMSWCLSCHRDPAPHLRPRDAVYAMGWTPADGVDPDALATRLMAEYRIRPAILTHCSTCHR